MSALLQLWSIARTTFIETFRQPVILVLLLITALLMVMGLALAGYTFDDDNKILQDMGLSTLLLLGLLSAALTAANIVWGEVENRTALTVVSKPVPRPVFILGKYCGLVAALAATYYLGSLMLLMVMRHRVMSTASDKFDMPVILLGGGALLLSALIAAVTNYLYRASFVPTMLGCALLLMSVSMILIYLFAPGWQLQPITTDINGQLLIAIGLIFLMVLILAATALAASTRLGPVMTLMVCVGLFFLGLTSDYVFGRFQDTFVLALIGYRGAPNLQYFWLTDALTQGHPVNASYIWQCLGYAACYIGALLALAVALFQSKEVG